MLPRVNTLARHHNMDAAALDGWLEAARAEYQQNMKGSTDKPRKKHVRAALEPIVRQAMELQDRLNNLPLPIKQSLDYWPVGEDSLLGNLSVELPFLADRAAEVIQVWKKKQSRDTISNIAIMRIAQAWRRLTGMPATYNSARTVKVSDNPDDPAPKYYGGEWYGEFLDFLTIACDIVGVKDREDLPVSADAAVKQFVELQRRNLDMR